MEKEKIQIEFDEINDLEYELRVIINDDRGELQSIPYVKNDTTTIRQMGETISTILESRGYAGSNLEIKINPLNLNGKKELINPLVPNLLKKSLGELNYLVNIN